MKKILVTTDFSNKSKAGIRFAIQLATLENFNLTFFHAYHILSPVSWHDDKIKAYEKFEANKLVEKLNLFVSKVYKAMNLVPGTARCVIQSSISAQTCIMEYAAQTNLRLFV